MNAKAHATGLVWLRRDLRAHDNAALAYALQSCEQVHVAFLFDRTILDPLPRRDRRVEFIRESLVALDQALRALAPGPGAGLITVHGLAQQEIPRLARSLHAQAVFASHDDEPAALARDAQVRGALADRGVSFHTCKDHLIFERSEVLTQSGQPYTVFTPYKSAWLKKLGDGVQRTHAIGPHAQALAERPLPLRLPVPSLFELGFESSNLAALRIPTGSAGGQALFEDFFERMDRYDETRDFPAIKGPSYLGVHLRFGTVSIRQLVSLARQRMAQGSRGAATWLSELIWREFYAQLLHHHPHVVSRAFKPAYDAIRWEQGAHAQALFQAWCEGRTGYPLVDAAMAQLNQTGYMHNRLRMVVASFLVKDLGLDWRWGETYFAQHLNDFDLASNNGGWQWASSSGCDAQPWFRIFNPLTQSEKFDPQGRFIRRYLPALARLAELDARAIHAPWKASAQTLQDAGVRLGDTYPLPLVQHDEARARTLARYAVVKKPA
jgi:deoxyribodipyrimidine photo-lyase